MGINAPHTGAIADVSAISTPALLATPPQRLAVLFERLDNERFHEDEFSRGESSPVARRMWNAGSKNAERIFREWLAEERGHQGLDELADAKAIDLRVKNALHEGI